MEKILTLIVQTITEKLRNARTALETEEKAKEIANLQGSIKGWNKLMDYLTEQFTLTEIFVEDTFEPAPLIDGMSTQEVNDLYAEMNKLIESEEWKTIEHLIAGYREELKESLMVSADCARDLYIAQSLYSGMTVYRERFEAITQEYRRRNEELNFDPAEQGELAENNPKEDE